MTKKTSNLGNLPWKKTLLGTAVALAASNQAFATSEPNSCDTSIAGTVNGCLISTEQTVTVTDTGIVYEGGSSVSNAAIHMTGEGLYGSIVNNGLISGSWVGIYASGNLTGDITNNGEISSDQTSAYSLHAAGIYVDGNLDGNIKNSGDITAVATDASYASAMGIYISDSNHGTIKNTGDISATATDASYAWAAGIGIDDHNYGSLSNSGSVSAVATADYAASAIGIYASNVNGSLTNSGSISAEANAYGDTYAAGIDVAGVDGSLTNSRFITADASSSYGDASAMGVNISFITEDGVVTNSGDITATAETGYGSYNSANAVGINARWVDGALVNSGGIFANADVDSANNSYGSAAGINSYGISSTGKITNSGAIEAEANVDSSYGGYIEASAAGIYVSGNAYGAISNTSNGNITASAGLNNDGGEGHASAIGIYASNVHSTITNTGDINVSTDISSYADTNAYMYLNVSSGYHNSTDNDYVDAYSYGSAVGIGSDYVDGEIINDGNINVSATGDSVADAQATAYAYAYNSAYAYAYANAYGQAAVGVGAVGIEVSNYLSGNITNNGSINAEASGSAYAYEYTNSYYNNGGYGSYASASADAEAYASAHAIGISVDNLDGSITNKGDITAMASMYVSDSNYGAFAGGQASATGIFASDISSYGSVSNSGNITATAMLENDGGEGMARAAGIASEYVYGLVNNSGNIAASVELDGGEGYGSVAGIQVEDYVGSYGSIINSKTITATLTGDVDTTAYGIATGIGVDYLAGTVSNTGSINASASIDAIYSLNGAVGISANEINGSNAKISNEGSITASVEPNNAYLSVGMAAGINSGNIYAGNISNKGDINASVQLDGGEGSGMAGGILASNLYNGGSITNSGDISASIGFDGGEGSAVGIRTSDVGSYGSISNSGSISASLQTDGGEGYAAGIEARNLDSLASIDNKGKLSITASGTDASISATGISVSDNAYGSISNSGTITVDASQNGDGYANATGIDLDHVGAYGSLANSSTITVSANADGGEGHASGIEFNWLDGSITNDGSIAVSASVADSSGNAVGISGSGIYSDGSLVNNGSISAVANADSYAWASGVELGYLNGELLNEGSISASASATYHAEATGIDISNDLNGSLANNGSITAYAKASEGQASATGIYASDVSGTLTNHGSISATAISSKDEDYNVYAVYIDDSSPSFSNYGSIAAYAEGGLDTTDTNELYAIYNDGSSNIVNHGTVSGSVYTSGNYTSTAGSTHEMVIQSVNSSDDYNSWVGDTADLSAATLKVKATGDSLIADGDVFYNIFSAGDLVLDDSQLGAVEDNLFLYDFNLVWEHGNEAATDDNGVDLEVSRRSINSSVGGIYSGIAGALESMYQDNPVCLSQDKTCNDLKALLGQINNANSQQALQGLLASVMPGIGGQTAYAVARNNSAINDAILARLGSGASSGDALANKKVWAKIVSSNASRDETNKAVGYDAENGGIVIGLDGDINSSTRIGVALAMTRGEIDGTGVINTQNVEMDQTQVLVYADWTLDNDRYANLQAGIGQGNNTLTTTAGEVDYDSDVYSLRGAYGAGYKLSDKWSVTPEVSLTYVSVSEDAYTLGLLDVDDRDSSTLEAGLIGKFAYAISDRASFSTRLGLAYDLLGDKTKTDAAFISGPTFEVDAEQDTVSGILGLGLDVAHSDSTSFSINYDFRDRGEFDSNTISAKLNHSF